MRLILLITGISCILYALYGLFSNKFRKIPTLSLKKEKITLKELSKLWLEPVGDDSRNEHTEKKIEEPAHSEEKKTEEIQISYKHQEIRDFYLKHIANKDFSRLHEKIARELLNILDREGDCPSVVNSFNEDEGKLPKDVYDILARTSLLQHTLNVTEKMIELLGGSGPFLSKAVITALAHDLGKIPSHRKLYATGDHPLVSIGLLNQIEAFNNAFSDEKKMRYSRQLKTTIATPMNSSVKNSRRRIRLPDGKNLQKTQKILFRMPLLILKPKNPSLNQHLSNVLTIASRRAISSLILFPTKAIKRDPAIRIYSAAQ